MVKDAVRFATVGASIVLLAAALVGCTASTPAVEPVTRSADGLQGQTIDLPIDSTLNITTGTLAVTDYNGTVADPSVAKFIAGSKTASAQFDPAIKPLAIGHTMVTLTTKDGSGQYVTFTLDVLKARSSTPAS